MSIENQITGLTLNGSRFALPDLIQFCEKQTANKQAPKWKLDIFRFILDFLSDSEFISQQTSGTTGTPKNIQLAKTAMLTSAKNTIDFFKLREGDVAVLCLPVRYIAGKMMIVRALLGGLNLHLIEPSGTPDFSGIEKIDFCAMVPMQATHLIEKKRWPNMNTLILGGVETGSELIEQLQHVKTQVYETYGMAETYSHVALKKLNGADAAEFFTTLPDVQIATDERDCLVIETTYLPEQLVTNDRVEIHAQNQFRWLGRIDNVINSGGIKFQAEVVEKEFSKILNKPCSVLGLPDQLLGEKMVLVVETSASENPNKIPEKLKSHFEKKMLPKNIYFVRAFPRNKSFKVDRKALQKLISASD